MRGAVCGLIAVVLGALAGIGTVALDVWSRPTCPPPCSGNEICALPYCFVFPVDWTREVELGAIVGAAVAAIGFVVIRRALALRRERSRPAAGAP